MDAEFNEIYDNEHIPTLLRVPGVLSATRYKTMTQRMPKYRLNEITNPN